MTTSSTSSEYLVISRGQWDPAVSKEDLQATIDEFYTWLERMVQDGKMKRGQRLKNQGRTVTRDEILTDGPFGETKEVVGGYWFIVARDLDEAAGIAAGNPCLRHGLFFEIRPIEPALASAFDVTTETPNQGRME